MNILDLDFRNALLVILNEIADGSDIFALRGGEQAYYVKGVIKEVENNTAVGEQFAKVILGTAIELATRDKDHSKELKQIEKSVASFLTKYSRISPPDCVKE